MRLAGLVAMTATLTCALVAPRTRVAARRSAPRAMKTPDAAPAPALDCALDDAPARGWRPPRAALAAAPAALLALAPLAARAADLGGSVELAQGALDSTFFQATSLIFLSEIGDKTFFIASILAARASRLVTFVGSFGALAFMTVVSVAVGQIFHAVPDNLTGGLPLDDYVAIASFVYFGAKSIVDALAIEEAGEVMAEELADAEEVLSESDVIERTRGKALELAGEAFALTVAAEIGDRSQIATIALSAAQNPYFVCAGACLGHGLATGIAVVGGAFISKYTNEKTVGLIGGVLFLLFAFTTALGTF